MSKSDNKQKLDEIMSTPGIKDALAFLNGQMDPVLSNLKGKAFVYKMNQDYIDQNNLRMIQMEHSQAINQFMIGNSMHKEPSVKYPYCTHRVDGRVNPGEVERRLKKTLHRKATRSQADMLCKFMLFKKGKFMPGKMI